jgi:hypothetical protein
MRSAVQIGSAAPKAIACAVAFLCFRLDSGYRMHATEYCRYPENMHRIKRGKACHTIKKACNFLKQRYNKDVNKIPKHLQGRVKFPIGGKVRERSCAGFGAIPKPTV